MSMRRVPRTKEYMSASAPDRQVCAAGYSGWFGVVSSGVQAGFAWVAGVAVDTGVPDGHHWTPEQIIELGIPAGDQRVAVDHVAHRKQARGVGGVHRVRGDDVLKPLIGLV